MLNESIYTKVCSIGHFEFGYYIKPEGGSIDEFKSVARYWDRDFCYLNEITLSYEENSGEAVKVIEKYLKEGVVLESVYGKHRFKGEYYLVYQNGVYVLFEKDEYVETQTKQLFNRGEIQDQLDIVMAVKSKVCAIYEEDEPLSELPALLEEQINGNLYSLTMSWDF